MQCPKCGKELPDTSKFCFACGAELASTPAAQNEQSPGAPEATKSNVSKEIVVTCVAIALVLVIVAIVAVTHCSTSGKEEPTSDAPETQTALGTSEGASTVTAESASEDSFDAGKPSDELIEDDVAQASGLVPKTVSGDFDQEASSFELDSVEILGKAVTASSNSAGSSRYPGSSTGTPDYTCDVTVRIYWSNNLMKRVEIAQGTYMRTKNTSWVLTSPYAKSGTSTYTLLSGVDTNKVVENCTSAYGSNNILSKAYVSEKSRKTFYDIYGDTTRSKIAVTDEQLDPATDTDAVSLSLRYENDAVVYEGTAEALFTFDGTSWKFTKIEFSDGAGTASWDKLLGSWDGSFDSQLVRSWGSWQAASSPCLAGANSPMRVTIDSIDPATLIITGTVSCIVHNHEFTWSGAVGSAEGDEYIEDVPFTGVLESKTLAFENGTTYYAAECALASDQDNLAETFYIGFNGTAYHSFVAELVTEYEAEKTTYSHCDCYVLSKADD